MPPAAALSNAPPASELNGLPHGTFDRWTIALARQHTSLMGAADGTTRSDEHAAADAGTGSAVPRGLRLPRAMLLGLTLVYLALGEYFVVQLADSSRTATKHRP